MCGHTTLGMGLEPDASGAVRMCMELNVHLNASRLILRYPHTSGLSSHELQSGGVPQTAQSLVGSI